MVYACAEMDFWKGFFPPANVSVAEAKKINLLINWLAEPKAHSWFSIHPTTELRGGATVCMQIDI